MCCFIVHCKSYCIQYLLAIHDVLKRPAKPRYFRKIDKGNCVTFRLPIRLVDLEVDLDKIRT